MTHKERESVENHRPGEVFENPVGERCVYIEMNGNRYLMCVNPNEDPSRVILRSGQRTSGLGYSASTGEVEAVFQLAQHFLVPKEG